LPIFTKDGKEIFFIHNPRCAGRYVRDLFIRNKFDLHFDNFDEAIEGIEVPHAPARIYNRLPVWNSIHFVVVRNPIDRFKSALQGYIYQHNLKVDYFGPNNNWTYEEFKNHVDDLINNNSSWYVPQSEFITETTHIWKLEDGFGQNFLDWLYDNMQVRLSSDGWNKQKWQMKTIEPFYHIQPVISKQVKEHIKKYYKKDYETFDYK